MQNNLQRAHVKLKDSFTWLNTITKVNHYLTQSEELRVSLMPILSKLHPFLLDDDILRSSAIP